VGNLPTLPTAPALFYQGGETLYLLTAYHIHGAHFSDLQHFANVTSIT
jgi:hypothetical protein